MILLSIFKKVVTLVLKEPDKLLELCEVVCRSCIEYDIKIENLKEVQKKQYEAIDNVCVEIKSIYKLLLKTSLTAVLSLFVVLINLVFNLFNSGR